MEEKQLIKDSVRCLKKYGSISSNNCTKLPSSFIKHIVTEDDTLQGIALKYGVTTEEIRRTNKLWANDSLFLRESLLIPTRNGTVPSCSSACLLDSSAQEDLFVNQSTNECAQNGLSRSSSLRSSYSSHWNSEESNDYNDFLSRIDEDIANKRQLVKETQDKSLFTQDLTSSTSRKRPALSRLKQQQLQQTQRVDHISDTGSTVLYVKTRGNKVCSSVQRLHDNGEQIFDL